MRTALLACLAALFACKTERAPDASPLGAASTASTASTAKARRAKLPALTRTNAIVVEVQRRAELAWTDAEAANTPDAWDLAADLFARSRDACVAACDELAYSVVLARANAIKADALPPPDPKPTTPQPLPPRVEAMIDAADRFVATSPDNAEALGVSFLAGKQYNDYGWIDESTTRFATVVAADPRADVALYSANLMLDAFNRGERFEDLVRWARDLQANAVLMASHPEIAETVAQILRAAASR